MNTLIIYDNTGKIFAQTTGSDIKPVGLQHTEIDVPSGKYASSVDVSVTPHKVILEDIPPSEIDQLRLEMARSNAEMFEMMVSMTMGGEV